MILITPGAGAGAGAASCCCHWQLAVGYDAKVTMQAGEQSGRWHRNVAPAADALKGIDCPPDKLRARHTDRLVNFVIVRNSHTISASFALKH